MQGHIEVLVGARGLPSIDTVFAAFPKKASQAAQATQRELNRQRAGGTRAAGSDATRIAAAETRAVLAVAKMRQREEARLEAQRIASEKRVSAEQQRGIQVRAKAELAAQRAEQRERVERQRAIDRQVRSQMALTAQRRREEAHAEREAHYYERSFAYRTGYHGIIRYAPGALHHGARLANDLLHGAGVNFNMGESIHRTVEWQKIARTVLNQAGTIGEQLPKEELYGAIREGSTKFGYSRESYAESIAEFARITGSPHAAMGLAGEIAKRAAGSNASLEDMMAMGGDIYSHLGEHVKDKKAATLAVIDAALLQGEKGGITIGMLARGFAKIGGSASQFEGGEVNNMKSLGALAQLARKYGGATSAAGALTAIERFTGQLSTTARAKQFKKFGVDIMSKTESGKFRDPLEILMDAVVAAKGDPQKLSKMLQSSVAVKAARPLMNAYNAAKDHGEDPIEAMKRELHHFLDLGNIQKNIEKNVADRDSDIGVKAQRFRNKVDDVAEKMMAKLLPRLEQLEPKVLSLVDAFGKAVEWAAENPGRAITLAIVGSLLRAGLESAVRAGLEKAIMGGFNLARNAGPVLAGPGGMPGGPMIMGRGAAGLAMRGMAALGVGAMVYQAGKGLGDLVGDKALGDTTANVGGGAAAGAMLGGPLGALIGAGAGGFIASHQMIQRDLGGYGGFGAGLKSLFTEGSFFKGLDRYENQKARARAAAEGPGGTPKALPQGPLPVQLDPNQLTNGFRAAFPPVQKVEIINLPTVPGSALAPPTVSDSGRAPAP